MSLLTRLKGRFMPPKDPTEIDFTQELDVDLSSDSSAERVREDQEDYDE